MRLLLINPRFPESFWSFKWAVEAILPNKRAVNPPLGLATLAALSPSHWEIRIVDENVESLPMAPEADLIGICGMGVQCKRQRELLRFYRGLGYYVVAGGSYASLCPELYAGDADTVVAGEAEYLWPAFCGEFEHSSPRPLYRETGVVDLKDSPTPRFDLLKLDRYTTATLQFSRGCPFRCEFCDIIVMFGRKPRHKSVEQVARELDELRRFGVINVFFVDDNLIGNKAVAKELLRFLRDYQARHRYKFNFGTEASFNLAQDAELLALFREANFSWVFIGIESPDPETLKATLKVQNTREDPLVAVRKIYAHGIDILAGFIVGFDRDTEATFGVQRDFILASGIQAAMVGLLTALPRTPLYERLRREGRLRQEADAGDNTKLGTNLVPLGMSYDAMVRGYHALYQGLFDDSAIAERIRNKMRHMPRPVYRGEYSLAQQFRIVGRLILKGVIPGGLSRVVAFLRTIPWLAPRKFPLVIVDWIAGLAMRDYIDRHFVSERDRKTALVARLGRSIRKAAAAYIRAGSVALSVTGPAAARQVVSVHIKGWVDHDFFRRIASPLKRVLRKTPSTLMLNIEELHESALPGLQRLLQRLRSHGDRVSIYVAEKLRSAVRVDSSVFILVLEPG